MPLFSHESFRSPLKLTRELWGCVALLLVDCALHAAILGYWWLAPDRVPQLPAFTKGLQYPEIHAGILCVALPSLMLILRPGLRSPARFERLGWALMVFAFCLFALVIFVSSNVVFSAGAYFVLGRALKEHARQQPGLEGLSG